MFFRWVGWTTNRYRLRGSPILPTSNLATAAGGDLARPCWQFIQSHCGATCLWNPSLSKGWKNLRQQGGYAEIYCVYIYIYLTRYRKLGPYIMLIIYPLRMFPELQSLKILSAWTFSLRTQVSWRARIHSPLSPCMWAPSVARIERIMAKPWTNQTRIKWFSWASSWLWRNLVILS